MVIKTRIPKGVQSNSLIEGMVANIAKVERIPLSQYYSEAEFALLLKIPKDSVRWFVAQSKVAHGVIMPDGSFLIHRNSTIRAIQKHYSGISKRQAKTLKKKNDSLQPLGL